MGRLWHTVNGKRRPTKEGYREAYRKFHSSAKAKAERASRNAARRAAIRSGRVQKGDGKDIHHADGNPRNNSSSNLRVTTAHENRGKREHSRKRGSRRNKSTWGK